MLVSCSFCISKNNVGFHIFYWQDAAKWQTAGIKFTHRPKIRFFAPSNLAWPTGTWVCLAVQNFTSIGTGVGMRPQKYQKFPLFGKEGLLYA